MRGKEAQMWECTGEISNPSWGIIEGFWNVLEKVNFKMSPK